LGGSGKLPRQIDRYVGLIDLIDTDDFDKYAYDRGMVYGGDELDVQDVIGILSKVVNSD